MDPVIVSVTNGDEFPISLVVTNTPGSAVDVSVTEPATNPIDITITEPAVNVVGVTVTENSVGPVEVAVTDGTPSAVQVSVTEVVPAPIEVDVTVLTGKQGIPGLPGEAPFGVALPFFGSTAPSDFAFPVGQTLARATYPDLAAVLAPDGTSPYWVDVNDFLMPDLSNKFLVGKGAATWSDTIGETGGSTDAVVVSHTHSNTLVAPEHTHNMAHTHAIDPPSTTTSSDSHSHSYYAAGTNKWVGSAAQTDAPSVRSYTTTTSDAHTHTLNIASFTSGGSSATNTGAGSDTALTGSITSEGVSGTNANLPPYLTCNYIMRLL